MDMKEKRDRIRMIKALVDLASAQMEGLRPPGGDDGHEISSITTHLRATQWEFESYLRRTEGL